MCSSIATPYCLSTNAADQAANAANGQHAGDEYHYANAQRTQQK